VPDCLMPTVRRAVHAHDADIAIVETEPVEGSVTVRWRAATQMQLFLALGAVWANGDRPRTALRRTSPACPSTQPDLRCATYR